MIRQYISNLNYFFFLIKSKLKLLSGVFIFLSSLLELIAITLLALLILMLSGSNKQEILSLPYIPDFVNFDNYLIFLIIIFFLYLKIFLYFDRLISLNI